MPVVRTPDPAAPPDDPGLLPYVVPDRDPEPAPMPTNVIGALAWVMANIGGVRKMTSAERSRAGMGGGSEGISYAYRGIDQIAAAAQPLLGQAGVVIVPRVVSRDVTDLTINAKPWTDTVVMVEWSVYGPGGVQDLIVAVTEGQGRDNSDKGINKAMTGAFKNLLLRLLCVGDPQDDTDGHTHEADERPPWVDPATDPVRITYQRVVDVATDPDMVAVLRSLGAQNDGRKYTESELADPRWRDLVNAALDMAESARDRAAAAPQAVVEPEVPQEGAETGDGHTAAEGALTHAELEFHGGDDLCGVCYAMLEPDGTCPDSEDHPKCPHCEATYDVDGNCDCAPSDAPTTDVQL